MLKLIYIPYDAVNIFLTIIKEEKGNALIVKI